MNGRDVSTGVLVLGVRAGVVAGRVVLLPVRVLARGPLQPIVVRAEQRVALVGSAARARARTRARKAAPDLERRLDSALAGPIPEAVMRRMVDRVLESPELDRVVEQVASSPAVRAAVAQQTTTFASEVATQVRERAGELDDVVEQTVNRHAVSPVRSLYGGLATRFVAFALDLVLLAVGFLAVTAFVALAISLFGHPARTVIATIVAVGWSLAAAIYFVFFWSLAGQTPGLRVMHQRVARDGAPPNVLRGLVRFLVMTLGIVAALAGVVLILFDGRRRALHDVVAGTVVESAERAP
jgi:uncharacterized RDD family membrane protein YckC